MSDAYALPLVRVRFKRPQMPNAARMEALTFGMLAGMVLADLVYRVLTGEMVVFNAIATAFVSLMTGLRALGYYVRHGECAPEDCRLAGLHRWIGAGWLIGTPLYAWLPWIWLGVAVLAANIYYGWRDGIERDLR